MDELPLGRELLDQVELVAVCGQHRNARLRRGQKNQRVVQALLALVWLEPLRPRERARDDAGVRPDLRIGRHQPAGRNAGEQLGIVVLQRRPTWSRRIGIRDTNR